MTNIEDMTISEIQKKLDKPKAKLRTDKQILYIAMTWAGIIQGITLTMGLFLRSETLLGIFAVEAVALPIFVFKYYLDYNKEINLKHMEMNYIKDYDEINGIK